MNDWGVKLIFPIAPNWFACKHFDDGVSLFWEPHVIPLFRCNIWHIRGRDRDLVIDSGMGFASLKEAGREVFGRKVCGIATHAHLDHTGGLYEFDECMAHHVEADGFRNPSWNYTRADEKFNPEFFSSSFTDFPFEGPVVDASPEVGYDFSQWKIRPARICRELEDGDIVDTGDRSFEVLHLPGHSPGSIGLWEVRTRTLFAGDAIYDGQLIDDLHHSSIPDYIKTMSRLATLPARVVHAGHTDSFCGERLASLAHRYLRRIGA
jgi:glyoxylase-like metal-dependent hydrolase (beta-lactamase superfamily II)